MQLKQVFTTEDGKVFETKAEAIDYLRRPKILEALRGLTGDNEELSNWLIDNRETVEQAFETGTIHVVTKSDRAKLDKALSAIAEDGNSKFSFVIENREAILKSFRWPSVKRMSEEEKLAAAKEILMGESGNEKLTDWVITNREAVLEAYEAGKVKREVNPKAAEALAAYRAKKAAEKAAQASAE